MGTNRNLSGLKGKASLVLISLFFVGVIIINLSAFLYAERSLNDFGSFYAAGLKARSGENPYDPNSEYIFDIVFPRIGAGGKMINLNPPVSVMIFQWMSRFDPYDALTVWQVTSALLYAALILLLAAAYRPNVTPTRFVWAFTLAGFWHTLVLGQIYVIPLAFTVLGWLWLRSGKYIPAGLAIGIVIAIKPNFMIWPIFLLLSGYYVTALMSVLSSAAISLVPLAIYGTNIYAQWLEASSLRHATLIMPGNNSILGLTERFQALLPGLVLSVILVLALLVSSKWKRSAQMEPAEYISALGILASILASPISWTGYTMLLLPVFFSLKKWSGAVVAAAAILSIPFQVVLQLHQTSFANFVIFGWLYGWAVLLVLAEVVRKTMITSSIQTN